MRVTSTGLTDVGCRRETNQDSLLINNELHLYVVADGMGGHVGGETASLLAVETIEKHLMSAKNNGSGSFEEKVGLVESTLPEQFRCAVEAACSAIFNEAREKPNLQGMGTTVTALLLKPSIEPESVDVYLAHVGDSRVYLVRDAQLQQISEDHSLVNEQIKAGVITPEEAKISRFKNIITRSVGFEADVLVDVMGLCGKAGDVFLMCSDGLTGFVDDEEILDYVEKYKGDKLSELPRVLVDLTNKRGGDDNVTVLLVQIDES